MCVFVPRSMHTNFGFHCGVLDVFVHKLQVVVYWHVGCRSVTGASGIYLSNGLLIWKCNERTVLCTLHNAYELKTLLSLMPTLNNKCHSFIKVFRVERKVFFFSAIWQWHHVPEARLHQSLLVFLWYKLHFQWLQEWREWTNLSTWHMEYVLLTYLFFVLQFFFFIKTWIV